MKNTHTHTHTHTHKVLATLGWFSSPLFLSKWTYVLVEVCSFFFPTYLTCSLLVLRGEKIVKPIGVKFSHMGFNNFHIWGKNCFNCLTKFTPYVSILVILWFEKGVINTLSITKSWYFHTFHKVWSISEKVKHTLKITYIGPSEPAPIGAFYSLCL